MKVGLLSMGRVCLSIGVLVAERGFYRKGSIFIVFWMDIRKISAPLWLRFGRGLSLLSLNNSQSSKKESVRASKLLPISSFLPFFSQFGIQFHYQKIYNRLNFQLIYSVIHISIHPSKELCSKMAPGEVGVSLPWWCHTLVPPPPGYWGLF